MAPPTNKAACQNHTLTIASTASNNAITGTGSSTNSSSSKSRDDGVAGDANTKRDKYAHTNSELRKKLLSEASRNVTQVCRFADGSEKPLKGKLDETGKRFIVQVDGQPIVMKPIGQIGTETVFGEEGLWQQCRLPGHSEVQVLPGVLSRVDQVFTAHVIDADGLKKQFRLHVQTDENGEKQYVQGGLDGKGQLKSFEADHPLVKHAGEGDIEYVKTAIVGDTTEQNIVARYSALAAAAKAGHHEIVDYMLKNGVPARDPYSRIEHFFSPEMVADPYGGFQKYVDHQWNSMDSYHHRPLRSAIANNDLKMIGMLLDNGAYIPDYRDLFRGVREADVGIDTLKFIAEHPACKFLLVQILNIPLQQALKVQNLERVRSLLEAGADPGGALSKAIESNQPKLVEILMDHYSATNNNPYQMYSALRAAASRDIQLVNSILQKGAPTNAPSGFGDKVYPVTPLSIALSQRKFDIAEALINAGADIHKQYRAPGQSPYYLTCTALEMYADIKEAVELLLANGADPKQGTPLYQAVRGTTETVKLLLEKGAEPDSRSVFLAAENGRLDMVQLLVKPEDVGLSKQVLKQYKSAIRKAGKRNVKGIERNHEEIITYLESMQPSVSDRLASTFRGVRFQRPATPLSTASAAQDPDSQNVVGETNQLLQSQDNTEVFSPPQNATHTDVTPSTLSTDPLVLAGGGRTSPTPTVKTARTTASVSATPHALGKLLEKNERKILAQLDTIYANEQARNYYEMSKLAFITLLKGSQALRTGVAPNDVKVEPSLMLGAAGSAMSGINPAIGVVNSILGTALGMVPGLGAASEAAKFAAQQVANINFSSNTQKMSKVTDVSGRNIDLLADTAARALTLLHMERLDDPEWVRSHVASGRLKHWAEEYKQRSQGESPAETDLRLLATEHALQLVLEMADTESPLFETIKEATADAEFKYELDHLKIKPMLAAHCKAYKTEVSEDDLDELVVWGERDSRTPRDLLNEEVEKTKGRMSMESNASHEMTSQLLNKIEERDDIIDELETTVGTLSTDLTRTQEELVDTKAELAKANQDLATLRGEFDHLSSQMQAVLKFLSLDPSTMTVRDSRQDPPDA